MEVPIWLKYDGDMGFQAGGSALQGEWTQAGIFLYFPPLVKIQVRNILFDIIAQTLLVHRVVQRRVRVEKKPPPLRQ